MPRSRYNKVAPSFPQPGGAGGFLGAELARQHIVADIADVLSKVGDIKASSARDPFITWGAIVVRRGTDGLGPLRSLYVPEPSIWPLFGTSMISQYLGKPSSEYFTAVGEPPKIRWYPKSYFNPKRGYVNHGDPNLDLVFVEMPDDVLLFAVMLEAGSAHAAADPTFWLPDGLDFGANPTDFEQRFGPPVAVGGDIESPPLGYINPWARYRFDDDVLIRGEFVADECVRFNYIAADLDAVL